MVALASSATNRCEIKNSRRVSLQLDETTFLRDGILVRNFETHYKELLIAFMYETVYCLQ